MSEPRTPVRPIGLGAPHQGPALIWTERGGTTGDAPPADPVDLVQQRRWNRIFDVIWTLVGWLLTPLAWLHPRAHRHVRGLPAPEPGWIWLHGASAGEHVAARALATVLPPQVWRTSSSWRTPVADAWPAPLDLPGVIGPWLDRARPRLLILVEADLWPGWLRGCARRGVPVVVVNAREGRGTARWRRHPRLWRWLTEGVRFIGQDQTGDLKLSASVQAATFSLGRHAFIAGSTRSGDEAALLDAWLRLPLPRPLLVLAPRHLDRVPEVLREIERRGLRALRRTDEGGLLGADTDVLLLDTLGELGGLYRQGRAAFVGGTFDPQIGGHSPAEAFSSGLPVVHGPQTHSNPVAWTQGIALRVGGPDPDALARAIRSALALGPRPPPVSESAAHAASLLPPGRTPPETPLHPRLAPLSRVWNVAVRSAPSWAGDPVDAGVPVVSVGALVAGGAGKTPAVAWLAAQIPGAWVVARGYGRQRGSEVRIGRPGEEGSAAWLGDELEMLRRRGIPVVSAPDRVAGARAAAEAGARWVLLDDGFQHRRLGRALDLVCLDARWPDGRGLIPVGWRREPWDALARAHWLWISNPDPNLTSGEDPLPPEIQAHWPLPRVIARARPAGWLRRGERLPLDAVTGAVDVGVGIARPEGFVCRLLELGLGVRSLATVPDHAPLPALPPGAVVTEKDAARLPPDADVYALRLELDVQGGAALVAAVRRLVSG